MPRARLDRLIQLLLAASVLLIPPGYVDPIKKPAEEEDAVETEIVAGPPSPPRKTTPADHQETEFEVYLTGYSYWDNTPRRSAAIARPVIHELAGGTGTYHDPITIAVGHRIEDGVQTLDYPEGTLFYLPDLKKYAVVEDVCGDGDTPQLGPCHVGHEGLPWLDIYIGGEQHDWDQAEACMREITSVHPVRMHPRDDYTVLPGTILQSTCTDQSVPSGQAMSGPDQPAPGQELPGSTILTTF